MIILGICLLIIAAIVPKLAILWAIGIIVLVVGVILLLLGRTGRAVGGRRHYLLLTPRCSRIVVRLPR